MIHVCSWCTRPLPINPHDDGTGITHGLCRDCADQIYATINRRLSEFIDGIAVPILILNNSLIVGTANESAMDAFGKELAHIEGIGVGSFFNCVYANGATPGDCQMSKECQSCTLRHAVLETFETGKSKTRLQVTVARKNQDDVEHVQYLVSTEKVNKFVMLRVDRVGARDRWDLGPLGEGSADPEETV